MMSRGGFSFAVENDEASHPSGRKAVILSDFSRFALYCIGLVTICMVAFLTSAKRMTVKSLQFQAPVPGSYGPEFSPDVSLTAEAVSVDPVSRTIVMNWYPASKSVNCDSDASTTEVVQDIFVKSALLDASSPSWSGDLTDMPVFRLNSTEVCLGLTTLSDSFRTVTKLTASKSFLTRQSLPTKVSTFQSYPFDVYLAPFLFYTQTPGTNIIEPLEISGSFGVAVNFEISLLSTGPVSRSGQQGNLQFYLRIERSTATKAFVVMVAISNWLTATAFLIICAATIVYKPHKIYAEMFVVPVGALFAFSSVRANLPGAPAGFGATVDTYTILPVLIIMSFCSFALLLVVLYRRIRQEVHSERQEERQMIDSAVVPIPRLSTLKCPDFLPNNSGRPSSDDPRAGEPTANAANSTQSTVVSTPQPTVLKLPDSLPNNYGQPLSEAQRARECCVEETARLSNSEMRGPSSPPTADAANSTQCISPVESQTK